MNSAMVNGASSKKKELKIPERWLACPHRSKLIAGKFVVFKTPLDQRYDAQVANEKFNFDILKASLEKEKLRLKVVIDMTFSERFYDSSELSAQGVLYVKIKCRGLDEAPDEEAKCRFVEEVNKFEGREGDVIGVHCTHGFNRSGFMVVSYLVEEFDFGLDAAVVEFKRARYPGIYKEQYLQRLCEVYQVEREEVPEVPSDLPSWVTDKESNKHPELYNATKAFMDGQVSGVDTVLETEVVVRVQERVKVICGWKMSGFPGGQPVSMSLKNMKKLVESEYRVSWKADGTRYLMYIEGQGEVYMLDRDNTVFKPHSLTFPWKQAHLRDTLLDGEMVVDTYDGKTFPRFYVYDIILMEDEQVGECPLERRQECIRDLVAERSAKVHHATESFDVKLKKFWPLNRTAGLLEEKFKKSLGHEMDGLIFQPASMAYLTGQCEDILKWKPPGLNSVDFKVKIDISSKEGHVTKKVVKWYCGDVAVITFDCTKGWSSFDNKIIECHWDRNTWKFMRVRTDKSYPNAYETYQNICDTINNPVSQESLLSSIATLTNKRPPPPHTHEPNPKKLKLPQ